MIRKPAVAGYFYPGDAQALRETVARLLIPGRPRKEALAVISPHAGYEYSGPVAGAVFSSVVLPDVFVIMAPSHRPIRSLFAIMNEGSWDTPLGEIPIQSDLAAAMAAGSDLIRIDPQAHQDEHSIEVQLPFIQAQTASASIVPVAVSHRAGYDDLVALGRATASAIRAFSQKVLLVASTDMSHYVSAAEAYRRDFLAVQSILDLDPRGLYDVVRNEDITMCGFQPTTAVLIAAMELGAREASLVMYATSGDRTGNMSEVVGYAGLRVF